MKNTVAIEDSGAAKIILAPVSVSENLLNGNSRLNDLLNARKGAVKANGKRNVPAAAKRSQPVGVKPVEPELPEFPAALAAGQATESKLVEVTQAAIESGFDRDDCIEWGIEAGLSDGYVRATVSRLIV